MALALWLAGLPEENSRAQRPSGCAISATRMSGPSGSCRGAADGRGCPVGRLAWPAVGATLARDPSGVSVSLSRLAIMTHTHRGDPPTRRPQVKSPGWPHLVSWRRIVPCRSAQLAQWDTPGQIGSCGWPEMATGQALVLPGVRTCGLTRGAHDAMATCLGWDQANAPQRQETLVARYQVAQWASCRRLIIEVPGSSPRLAAPHPTRTAAGPPGRRRWP